MEHSNSRIVCHRSVLRHRRELHPLILTRILSSILCHYAVFCQPCILVRILVYSARIPSSILSVSPWMVFYTIIAPYSVGFSCILDEVKKCTDFYLFGGGWRCGPRITFLGIRGEYMVLSVFFAVFCCILAMHEIRRIRPRIRSTFLVDRIPCIL